MTSTAPRRIASTCAAASLTAAAAFGVTTAGASGVALGAHLPKLPKIERQLHHDVRKLHCTPVERAHASRVECAAVNHAAGLLPTGPRVI